MVDDIILFICNTMENVRLTKLNQIWIWYYKINVSIKQKYVLIWIKSFALHFYVFFLFIFLFFSLVLYWIYIIQFLFIKWSTFMGTLINNFTILAADYKCNINIGNTVCRWILTINATSASEVWSVDEV